MKRRWTAGYVDLPQGRIAYHRTGGDLSPLLLAHGLTDNGLCWTRLARELEDDFDLIMLDAPGHGRSTRIDPKARDDHGSHIAGVVDALGLDRPVAMGHSMGARAVAMFANRFPDRVSKVVQEDPPLMLIRTEDDRAKRDRGFRAQVEKFAAMNLGEIEAFGRGQYPEWHTDEFEAWAVSKRQVDGNVMAQYEFLPWQRTIDLIRVPTLLVYGDAERGGIVSRAVAEEAQSINPHILPAHITGSGHNIRRERFEPYLALVRRFLLSPTPV